ncbi:MAG: hypothetical protein WBP44_00635 [Gammaproteobacteria bacterium]
MIRYQHGYMGFSAPDFKAFTATVLRYDTTTVKAESNITMANDVMTRMNPCPVKTAAVTP